MQRNLKVLAAVLIALAITTGAAAAASSPSVATGSVSSVEQQSVVLHGTVNPNGATTTYVFQWGLTSAYGASSAPRSAGAGTRAVAVKATAAGLIPGTVYHYRLVAFNKFGGTLGADRTFKTAGPPPPGVATGPATQLGSTFATLTGVVNPNRATTSWAFQYGPTTSYGAQTFGGVVPAGSAPVEVSSPLQQLEPGAVFHYRLIALHGTNIVSYGNDATFMTFPAVRPVPAMRARTRPRHPLRKPFVLTTTGGVGPPASIPAVFACSGGDVAIRFVFHGREIASQLAALQPNCSFTAQTVFPVRPGHGHHRPPAHLRVFIHFFGNGYLAPASARPEKIVLG
jgi:phosphodiesterase/alkaline phosphatase D-like protein